MPRYAMQTTLRGSLEDAQDKVVAVLKAQGFGVLTEIDAQKALAEKLGTEVEPYWAVIAVQCRIKSLLWLSCLGRRELVCLQCLMVWRKLETVNEQEYARTICKEISEVAIRLNQDELAALVAAILAAQRVFVCGAGRSLLMMKAFAMRLMHIGMEAYVVGETITPAIAPGDLLIAGSGSGQTRVTLATVQAAAVRGANTAVITAHCDSDIAQICDLVVTVPAPVTGAVSAISRQPPGSLFEQCLLVVGDALILTLMERLGTTIEQMRARHTKLE